MDSLTFKNMTLGDFFTNSQSHEDKQGTSDMLRFMQRGVFEIFWKRHRKDSKTLLTFANMGMATQTIVPEGTAFSAVMKRLKKDAFTGLIRNPIHFHHDFRFVAFVHGHEIYLVFENAAADAKLAQVWRYEKEAEGFVPGNTSLIEFLIGSEIAVPALA